MCTERALPITVNLEQGEKNYPFVITQFTNEKQGEYLISGINIKIFGVDIAGYQASLYAGHVYKKDKILLTVPSAAGHAFLKNADGFKKLASARSCKYSDQSEAADGALRMTILADDDRLAQPFLLKFTDTPDNWSLDNEVYSSGDELTKSIGFGTINVEIKVTDTKTQSLPTPTQFVEWKIATRKELWTIATGSTATGSETNELNALLGNMTVEQNGSG